MSDNEKNETDNKRGIRPAALSLEHVRGTYVVKSVQRGTDAELAAREFDEWLAAVEATVRLSGQQRTDEYMREVASLVMDVFENAADDALAEDVMPGVFGAIGLIEAYGAHPGDPR